MAKKPKAPIKVHTAVMISADKLRVHPDNSNKQSRHVQKELRESIKTLGFDESLLCVPDKDNPGSFVVVSGNHRYEAGVSVGMEEFPCVVRDDWTNVDSQIQLVRRNYIRGDLDKQAFTAAVDKLVLEEQLSLSSVQELLGMPDPDEFAALYEQKEEKEREMGARIAAGGGAGASNTVALIDDLGITISTLLDRYGHTAPNSFVIFPLSRKNHFFVQVNSGLKKTLEVIAQVCVQQGLDVNVALSGLLAVGMSTTGFKKAEPDVETVVRAGLIEGDPDLRSIQAIMGDPEIVTDDDV